MQMKNKRIRLVFLLLILLALALASVSPFINVEPVSRGSSASTGYSTFSLGAMVYQQIATTYLTAAFSFASYWDLLLIVLLLRILVHRFDCAVPKQMKKVRLRPIKFTSHFVAV
ncbi:MULTISPECIES: hypothetical protein [unclassified Paenibacillus]|uniref:hypothetical protein n=1 Tax=unclassified Paenibacillus TaxID=185978 RepID=UPI001AE4C548|nr:MULTISPECIES: hypothetical protein [unclassified Paenibacillus]MBP1156641.1 hypothetical protein [Paenibacillus sp. PvP091]MBP1172621.1 hypothetical protein [Paenibacillus sp. PvR098]MBP2439001.1 hypothetical protein [Paenibacillus sp. PvP052]